jgi:hypothetical protein
VGPDDASWKLTSDKVCTSLQPDVIRSTSLKERWAIAEEAAAAHGKTVRREDWRLSVGCHLAETRQQACEDIRWEPVESSPNTRAAPMAIRFLRCPPMKWSTTWWNISREACFRQALWSVPKSRWPWRTRRGLRQRSTWRVPCRFASTAAAHRPFAPTTGVRCLREERLPTAWVWEGTHVRTVRLLTLDA